MTKMEYLSRLRSRLSSLPREERNEAVRYYNDMFLDAGPENEQAVIANLGSPSELAHIILNDKKNISYAFSQTKRNVRKVNRNLTPQQRMLTIAVLILTLPLWGALLLALAGIVLLIFAVVAILVALLIASGLSLIAMGIAYIINTPSLTAALCGIGISLASIAFLIWTPLTNLAFYLFKLIVKGTMRFFNKVLGKTEVRAR